MAQLAEIRERRARFRAFMARLDGAGDPERAVTQGLYVEQPGEVARQIVARLDLRPSATQLIVGGIGTGKTTQLHVARERLLERLPDAVAIYLDVSAHQDLARLQPGTLLALAGLQLAKWAEECKTTNSFRDSFTRWAHGRHADFPDFGDGDPDFIPGVVTPPDEGLPYELRYRRDELQEFIAESLSDREIVLFIDSLDRTTDMTAFQTLVEQDMVALSSTGIGLVVVGPLHAIYGLHRAVLDRFDRIYRQPAVNLAPDSDGLRFLVDILRKRVDADLLPDPGCHVLAHWSGGVLRDLIRLAHQAGEEAYVDGADRIDLHHVTRAADTFGRSLLMGLSADEIDKLRAIRNSGKFVETSEEDLALLVTRRVLDYQDGAAARYGVHPTLEPLLA